MKHSPWVFCSPLHFRKETKTSSSSPWQYSTNTSSHQRWGISSKMDVRMSRNLLEIITAVFGGKLGQTLRSIDSLSQHHLDEWQRTCTTTHRQFRNLSLLYIFPWEVSESHGNMNIAHPLKTEKFQNKESNLHPSSMLSFKIAVIFKIMQLKRVDFYMFA